MGYYQTQAAVRAGRSHLDPDEIEHSPESDRRAARASAVHATRDRDAQRTAAWDAGERGEDRNYSDDPELQQIYDDARADAATARRQGRRAELTGKATGRAKATAGRTARGARSTTRREARAALAPVRAQTGQGLRFLTVSLVVVALYQLLTAAEQAPHAVPKIFGSVSAAVRWLENPTASIPYK